jgi:hypothetical protein
MAILLGFAACTSGDPPKQAFVVDGFVNVPTIQAGSVIGLWELAGSPVRHYKLGDGPTLGGEFTLGFPTEPPPAALNADGIGVAYVLLLPELTTIPEGPVTLASLPAQGISSNGAIIYKTTDATGPAWSRALPLRFSCVQCVRSGALDTFVLQPCASILVERTTDRCNWF